MRRFLRLATHKAPPKPQNDGVAQTVFFRFNTEFTLVSGSRMPNLMYMATFNNKAERDERWEAFNNDPAWKQLKAMEEYQHIQSGHPITQPHRLF